MQQLLRIPEVLGETGLKRSSLYVLVAAGKFPAPVKLSERSSAWIQTEVEAWIEQRIEHRDQQKAGAV